MDNIIFVLRYVRFISVYWVVSQVLYYLRKGMIYFYDDNIKL